MSNILVNAVYCKKCEQPIVSLQRHNFVQCPGEHVAVDGGNEYLKRTWWPGVYSGEDWVDISVIEEENGNIRLATATAN